MGLTTKWDKHINEKNPESTLYFHGNNEWPHVEIVLEYEKEHD